MVAAAAVEVVVAAAVAAAVRLSKSSLGQINPNSISSLRGFFLSSSSTSPN